MSGPLIQELVPQVKRNATLSDARYWGFYSVCGLLLRLREQYRFEKGIRPWEGIDRDDIAQWIGERERLWKDMEHLEYSPITLNRREFGPFETEGINRVIRGEQGLYGAGYGLFGKPVFFVADLAGSEVIDGYEVYISGTEHARDLSTNPAMLQGRTIFARREITRLLIWEKFEEYRVKKAHGVLAAAFSSYGVSPGEEAAELDGKLEQVAEGELRCYIHHEVGEAVETQRLGPRWTGMLSLLAPSRASVYVRAVKDTLADASDRGMLRHIIERQHPGSLAFYIAFLHGLRRPLARELLGAFDRFQKNKRWPEVEQARQNCYRRAATLAEELLALYEREEDPGKLTARVGRLAHREGQGP